MNKTLKRLAVFATAAVMSASAFAFAACTPDSGETGKNPNPVVQEKKVTKIAVTQRPRLKYIVGETFDKTGMEVTATYDDGTTEKVTDYTVDKTAPLTLKDSSVTVMYKGKVVFLPLKIGIELNEKFSIPNADNAVYTVEAESMDFTYCTNSNDASLKPNAEASQNASGGLSIGSLSVANNMFGFKVNCAVETEVQIVLRASAVVNDIPVDENMPLFVNDVLLNSEYTLTWGGDGAFFNWEHAYYRKVTFKAGLNEVYYKVQQGHAPNIDCMYFIASPTGEEVLGPGNVHIPPAPEYEQKLEITSAETQTYVVEAESLDFSSCINHNHPDQIPNQEHPDESRNTSGGLCVSSLAVAGNRFGFKVHSTVEADMSIVLRVSSGKPENHVLDENLQVKWNDTVLVTNTTIEFVKDTWHNWIDVTVTGLKLEEGDNVFDFYVKQSSCPNVDCFKIIVSPEEQETPEPGEHVCADVCETCNKCTSECTDPVCAEKCEGHESAPEWEKKADVTSAENARYTIEAESLDLSKCTHSDGTAGKQPNQEHPSTETSGGLCVSSLGRRGNKLGFSVYSTVEGNANLTLRVSSGAPGVCNLNKNLVLLWNGVEYKTHVICPNPDPGSGGVGWHNWENATLFNVPLTVGYNTFVLEVMGNACPNIDCFILEVNPDNSGVEFPEALPEYEQKLEITTGDAASYTVEAEALDYTKCYNSNDRNVIPSVENPAAERETSGGQSVGALGVAGNKFGFTVNSTVEGKVRITLRVSSGNRNAQNLDECLKLLWNNTEYKTGFTVSAVPKDASGNELWHSWETAVITVDLDLIIGDNVFVVEVLQNSCPNIDCFIIEVLDESEVPPVTEGEDTGAETQE